MKGWLNQVARRKPVRPWTSTPNNERPMPSDAELDILDRAADALELPLFQLGDLALIGKVLIIAGEVEEHVAGGERGPAAGAIRRVAARPP